LQANGPPVFNITVDASQQRHQQATAGPPAQDIAAHDVTHNVMLDISSSTTSQQEEGKQVCTACCLFFCSGSLVGVLFAVGRNELSDQVK